MTAGIAALADPGTKTDIFAHLLRLAEPGYVKHLCSKLPGSYIAYAGMRLKDCYNRHCLFVRRKHVSEDKKLQTMKHLEDVKQ